MVYIAMKQAVQKLGSPTSESVNGADGSLSQKKNIKIVALRVVLNRIIHKYREPLTV